MSKTSSSPRFLWGAATSSHQIEGDNQHNDWWAWETKGKVDGGVRSGHATDHRHRFREDLASAKALGMNSYRFSFEWSRFEPREGAWEKEACDWYGELISECERLGLIPMATLHHFTFPQWIADQGGLAADTTPEKFARFTKRIAETFGSRIPLWCTVNEPMVLITGAYIGRFMPPCEYDLRAASRACANMLKCHVLAYDVLKSTITKREGPFADHPLEVGFAHNMLHFKPERKWHPLEILTARAMSHFHNDAWLEAVNGERQRFGLPGLMANAKEVASARGRRTYDFIGINYYTKSYIRWGVKTVTKDTNPETRIRVTFARAYDTTSDLGWAVHPKGFTKMLEKLRRFNAPIYVTENGCADADDRMRGPYLTSHLGALASAIESGLDVRGYFHWSLLDNFEWIKGFWPRFGLYSVNYDTFERTPRPSAELYKNIIAAHGGSKPPASAVMRQFNTSVSSSPDAHSD